MDLSELKGKHAGAELIVAGCGPSAAGFEPPDGALVVGVNDADRHLACDYLLIVNNWNEFTEDRQKVMLGTTARLVFHHYKGVERGMAPVVGRDRLVAYRLACAGLSRECDGIALDFSNSSPYVACLLAEYMGARRIGLIGVDLVDHALGRGNAMARVERDFAHLYVALGKRNVELVNYSKESRLRVVPMAHVTGPREGSNAALQ